MGEYRCIADNGIPPSANQTFSIEVHCKYEYNFISKQFLISFLEYVRRINTPLILFYILFAFIPFSYLSDNLNSIIMKSYYFFFFFLFFWLGCVTV